MDSFAIRLDGCQYINPLNIHAFTQIRKKMCKVFDAIGAQQYRCTWPVLSGLFPPSTKLSRQQRLHLPELQ
jgi:hypothetical protein